MKWNVVFTIEKTNFLCLLFLFFFFFSFFHFFNVTIWSCQDALLIKSRFTIFFKSRCHYFVESRCHCFIKSRCTISEVEMHCWWSQVKMSQIDRVKMYYLVDDICNVGQVELRCTFCSTAYAVLVKSRGTSSRVEIYYLVESICQYFIKLRCQFFIGMRCHYFVELRYHFDLCQVKMLLFH